MKKLIIFLIIVVLGFVILFFFKRSNENKIPTIPGKIIPMESLQDTSHTGI